MRPVFLFIVLASIAGCHHAPCGPACEEACPPPSPCRSAQATTCTARCPNSPWCPRPAEVEIEQPPANVTVRPAPKVKVRLPQQEVLVDPQPGPNMATATMPQLMQNQQQLLQGMSPVSYSTVLAVPPTRLALTWDSIPINLPFPRLVGLPTTQQITMQAPAQMMAAYAPPAQAVFAQPIQQAMYAQQMLPPPQQVIQPVIQPVIHQAPAPLAALPGAPMAAAASPPVNPADYCQQLDALQQAVNAARAAMCPPK